MAVPSNSRFKFTQLIAVKAPDGSIVEAYGRWVKPAFFDDPNLSAATYQVRNDFAGRPDEISKEVYGTPEYFWVIIAYNSPRDPLNWPKVGDVIMIPDPAAVASAL